MQIVYHTLDGHHVAEVSIFGRVNHINDNVGRDDATRERLDGHMGLGLRELSYPSSGKKEHARLTFEWSENGMIWASSDPTPDCEVIHKFLRSDCRSRRPVTGHPGSSRNCTYINRD